MVELQQLADMRYYENGGRDLKGDVFAMSVSRAELISFGDIFNDKRHAPTQR